MRRRELIDMNVCPVVSFECAGDGYAEQVGEWIANPHAYFKSFGLEARTFMEGRRVAQKAIRNGDGQIRARIQI